MKITPYDGGRVGADQVNQASGSAGDGLVAFPGGALTGCAIIRYDDQAGAGQFVPAGPDDLLGDAVRATGLRPSPPSTFHLPRRVPGGVRGSWIRDPEV